ncbi:MAG TPA: GldM family protein [Bacteroidia bacterium]
MAGGGKETPRQKMIGMMYLVLTALLAMNVSKDILKAFVTVNDNLERTNVNFNKNTENIMKAFAEAKASNPSAIPYYEKSVESLKITKDLFDHIEKLKHYVIDETEQNGGAKDTTRLRYTDKKDNYDAPTHLLIGDDERNPSDGPNTAKELRGKFNTAHDKLMAIIDGMQKDSKTKLLEADYKALKEKIGTLKIKDPDETEDGVPITWEIFNFYHLPLAGVITNLSQMQSDIKNIESELVGQLAGASGKIAIKFNALSAAVVAPSSYIQSGQEYTADVFLAASSTDFKDDNMQILLGEGTYDSIKKLYTFANGTGEPVPLVNGRGKIKRAGAGEGDQKYSGAIKFKKPTGEYEFYPFSGEYKVAKAAATVSADQMNVFYCGVENPVSVSAAGIAPKDLSISASGGGASYSPTGAGKYNFKFTTPGECTINVTAKTPQGAKSQGSYKFRVKPLPKPELKVGGKFSPTELSKKDLFATGALVAGANGFDFKANYITQSYTIYGKVKGKLVVAEGNGANLNAEGINIMKNADAGTRVLIDARVKGPDGRVNSASCGIKVNK